MRGLNVGLVSVSVRSACAVEERSETLYFYFFLSLSNVWMLSSGRDFFFSFSFFGATALRRTSRLHSDSGQMEEIELSIGIFLDFGDFWTNNCPSRTTMDKKKTGRIVVSFLFTC